MTRLTSQAGASFGYWAPTKIDDEYLVELQFPRGSKIYDRMRRSDPQINAILQAVFSPILAAKWTVEPIDEDKQSITIAQFVQDSLFETKYGWIETLRNILLYIPFGYMVIEKIYKRENDKIVISELAPRLPKTIVEFKFDSTGNNLTEVVQKINGVTYHLPIENCVVFTFQREGANVSGLSFLRSIYKPWAIKEDLEKIQAIMFERYGVGTPWATAPSNLKPDSEEFKRIEETLKNISVNETGYIVLPNGQQIGILSNAHTAPDIKTAIQYYDNQIAIAWLAMFIMLGQTSSGNRALGQTFMQFFLTTVQSIGNQIAETLNRYLVPELVQLNFSVNKFPKIKMLEIHDVDYEIVAVLKNAGLITGTEETENQLRELTGLKRLEKGEYDEKNNNGNQKLSTDVDYDLQGEKKKVDRISDFDIGKKVEQYQYQTNRRKYTTVETEYGLPQVKTQLDKAQKETVNKLLVIRKKQSQEIATQINDNISPSKIIVSHIDELHDILLKEYKAQRKMGRQLEQENIRRQGASFADKVPTKTNELLDLVDELLLVEVDGGSNKLKTMMLTEATRLKRLGVVGNDLQLRLVQYVADEVSEVTWHQMAATAINGGWGDGVNITANQFKDEINYQVYSSVLDANTCEVCRAADGAVHAINNVSYMAPNPDCLGTWRCRCVNITMYKV